MTYSNFKKCSGVIALLVVASCQCCALETGKVIKLVAESTDKRGQIAERNFYERVANGNCAGAQELMSKLKPLMDTSDLEKDYFFGCSGSTAAIVAGFPALTQDGDIRRVAKYLRARLESSGTKDDFISNSILVVKFNETFPSKYRRYWTNVFLLLNAGRVKEAEENLVVTYVKDPGSTEYKRTMELIKIAGSAPQFVMETSYRLNNVSRKDLYLAGVRKWLREYPDTLNAQYNVKKLLSLGGVFSKEELAEFSLYKNERKYPFLISKASEVCSRNSTALTGSSNEKADVKTVGPSDIPLTNGWRLNTCAAVTHNSGDILAIGSFLSGNGKDIPFGKILPYYEGGWHENTDFYDSTTVVTTLPAPAGDTWLIHKYCRDIPGEVGYRKSIYTLYELAAEGPKEIRPFEGSSAGDGGETWLKEFSFSIDTSGVLQVSEIDTKSEILTDKVSQDQISTKVSRWDGHDFVFVSTSSENQLYTYGNTNSGAYKKPVYAVITGDIYKTPELTEPKTVTGMEAILVSCLHGTIKPWNAVVLKIVNKNNPDEVWYTRPESAGDIGARLGRSR